MSFAKILQAIALFSSRIALQKGKKPNRSCNAKDYPEQQEGTVMMITVTERNIFNAVPTFATIILIGVVAICGDSPEMMKILICIMGLILIGFTIVGWMNCPLGRLNLKGGAFFLIFIGPIIHLCRALISCVIGFVFSLFYAFKILIYGIIRLVRSVVWCIRSRRTGNRR